MCVFRLSPFSVLRIVFRFFFVFMSHLIGPETLKVIVVVFRLLLSPR